MGLEALEVVLEHRNEALCRLGEGGFVLPGLDRIEDVRLDARHRGRDREPSSAAVSSRRVTRIGMRRPTPTPPPVQPVLTSQQSTWWRAMRSRKRLP